MHLTGVYYFENGMDVNAVDDDGCNALHYSNAAGLKLESIYLVSQGIDYSLKNGNGETPFDIIPAAAELFMVPALNKSIKAMKKKDLNPIKALTGLFS